VHFLSHFYRAKFNTNHALEVTLEEKVRMDIAVGHRRAAPSEAIRADDPMGGEDPVSRAGADPTAGDDHARSLGNAGRNGYGLGHCRSDSSAHPSFNLNYPDAIDLNLNH